MATLYSSGASTPDATESTAGKLRIATNAEATAGTNDTTAMTPAKVAAAISASPTTGALVYRGSYDASTASPDLTTASKGDFYIVSVSGALDGVALSVGDHVVFNQDASSPVTSAMFDVIDNTDAVSSVNTQTGAVTLTASDVGALATGDNVSALVNDSGYLTSAPVTSVNTLTGAVNLTAADVGALATGDNVSALVNDSGYLTSAPVTSVNTQTGAVTLTASDVGALATGDNISELTNDSGYLTSTLSASIAVDTDGAYDLGTESARFDKIFANLDGAVCFKASNASGAQIAKGQAVYINGVSGDVPTVALADADAAAMPSAGLAGETANAGAEIRIITFGNLTDVDTSAFSLGDTLYIDTTAGALTATPPAGEAAKLQNIGKVIRVHATSGVIKVGGAGRSAATPNLDQNKIFLGDSNNRAVSTALSAIDVGSFNDDGTYLTSAPVTSVNSLTGAVNLTAADVGALATGDNVSALVNDAGYITSAPVSSVNSLTGAVTLSANDLAADHTANNYTPANANIDGHLSGIDSALASVSGAGNPNIYVSTSTTYAPSTSDAPNLLVWYGGSNTSTFTLTLPNILSILTGTGAVNSVVESFTMWVGRGYDGDITLSSTNGIDGLGGTISYASTLTVPAGTWVKIVGWKTSSTNARYLVEVPESAPVTSVNSLTGAVTLSADDLAADHTANNYTPANANIDGHLSGIDSALASAGGISNLVEDTTPQLGGDLDPNGNAISGALVPATANTHALGSASAEWSDIFLGDGAVINFGNDQDIKLSHDADRGLILQKAPGSAFYPRLIIQNEDSGTLSHGELMFESLSTTPANNDFISRILARGKNSAAAGFDYTKLVSRIGDVTDGTEAGRVLIQVATGGTVAGNTGTTALELFGDSSGEITVKIAEHDGASSGLMLGNTLLTSNASELNLLDGGATVGASVTITDTDGIILNDGGVTKLVPALDLKTYAGGGGGGGTSYTYSAISTTTTAQAWYHYSVDTSGGAVTLNLPALSSVTDGDEIRVKLRVAGNDLTIDANSTETIDGSQTQTLSVATSSITLVAGSTEWEIV